MGKQQETSGPQFRADRPAEQQAVRTTIVGGRPPGSGQSLGEIPRGIEVLVKKASVDHDFKQLLLEKRADAAGEIGLALEPAEQIMLRAVPAAQLNAIIARTTVPRDHRRAFLGKAAAAMLAALSATAAGIARPEEIPATKGIAPDPPVERPSTALEDRVVAIVAGQLGIPKRSILRTTTFAGDLQADEANRHNIRTALEKEFDITVPLEAFYGLETVGQVFAYVETGAAIRQRVILIIAGELRVDKQHISGDTSLVGDLKVSPAQRARLRKILADEFRIYIFWEAFKGLGTVGQVVDYIREAVRKRQAAAAAKQQPAPPSPVTRGTRPDRPASMGIRPGTPRPTAPPQRRPLGGIRPG